MNGRVPALAASFGFAILMSLLPVNRALCLTSQDVPAAESPTASSSGIAPEPAPDPSPPVTEREALPNENQANPEGASGSTAQSDMSAETTGGDTGSADEQSAGAADVQQIEPAAEASSAPPALDARALTVGPELADQSLDPEIKKAIAPALAASLRLTESARKQLANGQVDDAMRGLARAVSLDPSNAFAYYYIGRAYLARKNYAQALTFFRRADIGFHAQPDWRGEALSYEGLCDEESGKSMDAAQAYKQALAASPANFRARVGYGRLANIMSPAQDLDDQASGQDLATIPSAPESAPVEQAPPPPPE